MNTGESSHSFLQGIFLIQELNLSHIFAGRFFTIWATREASLIMENCKVFPGNPVVEDPPSKAGDVGSIPS